MYVVSSSYGTMSCKVSIFGNIDMNPSIIVVDLPEELIMGQVRKIFKVKYVLLYVNSTIWIGLAISTPGEVKCAYPHMSQNCSLFDCIKSCICHSCSFVDKVYAMHNKLIRTVFFSFL